MIQIKIVETTSEFISLGPLWNDLLSRSAQNNPYLTHEWLFSWWEAFARPSDRLYVLLFYEKAADQENLIGILPTMIKTVSKLPRMRIMRFLASEYVGSDFLDVIVAPGKENDLQQAIYEHFKQPWPFEMIEWTNITENSHLVGTLQNLSSSARVPFEPGVCEVCPYIDLPDSFDSYYAALGKRARKIFRDRKKLESQGMALEVITSRDDLPAAITDFIDMHNMVRSYKGDLGSFATETHRRFRRTVFERFFDKGWLKLAFLRMHDQRVAGGCMFDYAQRIYDHSAGYYLEWARMRVGFYLHLLAIRQAIEDGKITFENGRGADEYKYTLGANGERKLMVLSLNDGSIKSSVYLKTQALAARLKAAEKTFVPKSLHQVLLKARLKLQSFSLSEKVPLGRVQDDKAG